MRAHQSIWTPAEGWEPLPSSPIPPDLVLVFGGREALESGPALKALGEKLPSARVYGCSTGGEIAGSHVYDDSVVATAMWFDKSRVQSARASLGEAPNAEALGRLLASRLDTHELVHVLALSDGLQINGSELARGLRAGLPAHVSVSGGLSGDGRAMKSTVVCHAGVVEHGMVAVIGFSGALDVGIGSIGGWDEFGPSRLVTRSTGNVLYELDGEPALALYKKYLGPHAAGLPSSALLFPLMVKESADAQPVVRTILAVDEATGSMTFAGDVPQGSHAQLMRANFERIIAAGEAAADSTRHPANPEFALLISCVGRKWILKQRVEEEVEAVRSSLGTSVVTTGFYSYGELAPFQRGAPCLLHNQTMTVTTFREK